MVGAFVEECRQVWQALIPTLAPKQLSLDLRGLTFVDASGTQLLREIYRATAAEMLTDSLLIRHFAEQAMRQTVSNGSKGV
jgi:hypothetical protein